MKRSPINLTPDEAAAIHWFIDHLCFDDYTQHVPPHLGKEVVTERGYDIRNALAKLQEQLPAGSSGWMYRTENAGRSP